MLAPAAVILPLLMQSGFAQLRPGRPPRTLEFFALCASAAVAASALAAVHRGRLRPGEWWPVAAYAVALTNTLRAMPFQTVHWDFSAYRRAAEAMHAHASPYPDPAYYSYPPPLAQWFGLAVSAVNASAGRAPMDESGWWSVFVAVQVLQIGAVAVVFACLYRAARDYSMSEPAAALSVAALLVVNEPLALTIQNSQMNALMLAMVLGAVTLARRADWAAGAALAVPGVMKLYPLTLLPAWLVAGQRRAVGWAIVWVAALVALATPWILWLEFARMWMRPAAYPTVGDSTLFNLLANGARFAGLSPRDHPQPWIRLVWAALVVVVALWSAWRVVERLRLERSKATALFTVTAEVLALNLFISPLVWPHHFVFALPLAICAVATAGRRHPVLVGSAMFLTFAMPWFDLFLVGYARLAGVALALYAVRPGAAQP